MSTRYQVHQKILELEGFKSSLEAFEPAHSGILMVLVGGSLGPGGAPHSGKSDFTIFHLL